MPDLPHNERMSNDSPSDADSFVDSFLVTFTEGAFDALFIDRSSVDWLWPSRVSSYSSLTFLSKGSSILVKFPASSCVNDESLLEVILISSLTNGRFISFGGGCTCVSDVTTALFVAWKITAFAWHFLRKRQRRKVRLPLARFRMYSYPLIKYPLPTTPLRPTRYILKSTSLSGGISEQKCIKW